MRYHMGDPWKEFQGLPEMLVGRCPLLVGSSLQAADDTLTNWQMAGILLHTYVLVDEQDCDIFPLGVFFESVFNRGCLNL